MEQATFSLRFTDENVEAKGLCLEREQDVTADVLHS